MRRGSIFKPLPATQPRATRLAMAQLWHYTFFATSCYKEAGRSSHLTVLGLLEDALSGLGLATEFRSKKTPRNRLGMASIIPQKNVFIPWHSEVYGRVDSEAQNRRKWHEKNLFYKKSCSSKQKNSIFLSKTCFETEFQEFASFFLLWNGIPRVFYVSISVRHFYRHRNCPVR
jgi:hypothetical protein